MKARMLWSERLDVLSAGASPWSTFSHDLGRETFRQDDAPGATNRNQRPRLRPSNEAKREQDGDGAGRGRLSGWVRRAVDRFEAWSWQRQVRAQEAYLAQAHDLADLERRLRHMDDATLARGRALR